MRSKHHSPPQNHSRSSVPGHVAETPGAPPHPTNEDGGAAHPKQEKHEELHITDVRSDDFTDQHQGHEVNRRSSTLLHRADTGLNNAGNDHNTLTVVGGVAVRPENWATCVRCAGTTTQHLRPRNQSTEDLTFDCVSCQRPRNVATTACYRECSSCGARQCNQCLMKWAQGAQTWGEAQSQEQGAMRAKYLVVGTSLAVFITLFIAAALSFMLILAFVFDFGGRDTLVWYHSCQVPGYAACSSGKDSHGRLRPADIIWFYGELYTAEQLRSGVWDQTVFNVWTDHVGLQDLAKALTMQEHLQPIVETLLGSTLSAATVPKLYDTYQDEVVIIPGSAAAQTNLTVTLIFQTVITTVSNITARNVFNVGATVATGNVTGFRSLSLSAAEQNEAPPLQFLRAGLAFPVHTPSRWMNSSRRLLYARAAPWSIVDTTGAVTVYTRVNVTFPLGTCLDSDPSTAKLDPSFQVGFARLTWCVMYGQEFDVVPPWTFILAAASKNVFMIFVVQRLMTVIVGKLKTIAGNSRALLGAAARVGPTAVNWIRTPPAPRIVQRTHMFHLWDPLMSAKNKLEAKPEACESDTNKVASPGMAYTKARKSQTTPSHADEIDDEDPLPLEPSPTTASPQSAGASHGAHAMLTTDYVNDDYAMLDLNGRVVLLPSLQAEHFCMSRYFELKRADAIMVREWLVKDFIPSSVFGQLQLASLMNSPERPSFPMTETEMAYVVAALWTRHAGWGPDDKFGFCGEHSACRKTRKQLKAMFPDLLRERPDLPFAAIAKILEEAGVPEKFRGEMHTTIADDLWAMAHFAYDYGTPLNMVFSKQTVLLYAIVYVCTDNDTALTSAGLLRLSDTSQLSASSRIRHYTMHAGESDVLENEVSKDAFETLVTTRDALIAELNKCPMRVTRVRWDDDEPAPDAKTEKKTNASFGGPNNNWRFCDLVHFYVQIFLGMPQSRGFLSAHTQIAHHVVNTAYPKQAVLLAGIGSAFLVMLNAAIAAHEQPLRETRTVMLPFFHRWTNSGVLVTNLTYAMQLWSIPIWYGVNPESYVAPRVHTIYLGVTMVAAVAALPLLLAGLIPSLFLLVVVSVIIFAGGSFAKKSLDLFARKFDSDGTGVTAAFITVAAQTVLVSVIFGLLIQTPNNVGYALVLDLFEGRELPSDMWYWLMTAVGDEYLGRRMSCTLEHLQLSFTSLIGTLSYVALP